MNEFYVIPNNKMILDYNLILPLESYSIGFDVYYSVSEINNLATTHNVSVIINKFLHKSDIDNIMNVIKALKNVKYYFVEDLGLVSILTKSQVVVSQNHIINNYDSINYFKSLGYDKILINNDLTISEIKDIIKNTSSHLFMYYISKNNLMYSKRHLISSFNEYKKDNLEMIGTINEKVSNHELIIKEENCGTCIFNSRIFSANKYIDELDTIGKIVNLSNMSIDEANIILDNLCNKELSKLIKVDDYFLDNKIAYKVGDLK